MIKIEDKRGTGRTSRLLLIAKEQGQTIVVPTFRHLQFVSHLAERYFGKDHGIKIISTCQFFDPDFYPDENERFLIDDLDCILACKHVDGYVIEEEK